MRPAFLALAFAAAFCAGERGVDFLFGFLVSQNAFFLAAITSSLVSCLFSAQEQVETFVQGVSSLVSLILLFAQNRKG